MPMAMMIPNSVLAVGWIPFVVVVVLAFVFSFVYIRYLQSRYDSELSSTFVAILSLTSILVTSALVPVDIFLVSYMKNADGSFKQWANSSEVRNSLEDTVLYAYYALYCTLMVFVFILLPFVYFYHEEKDEEVTRKKRFCVAALYTGGFMFVALVMFLIGAFVPMSQQLPSSNHTSSNDTSEWKRIELLFKELGSNKGEDAISFIMSIIALIGMISLLFYTAYGMSSLPIDMIKSYRSVKKERLEVLNEQNDIDSQIRIIKIKYKPGKSMSGRDRRKIEDLEEQELMLTRRERHLEQRQNSYIRKCLLFCRPFEIFFGIICLLVMLLVFISLLLTNIDKAIHSLGYKMGYALPKTFLPNPLDITLVFCQKVFPLDYIIMAAVIMYFVFCSMSGIQNIGVWFLWIKLFKVKPRRTRPQGLLFLCMILIFLIMAVNVIIYETMPQYSMYGSQHYMANETVHEGNKTHQIFKSKPCNIQAPSEDCVMTRMTMILTRYFYKVWFFGACYYWISWAFLGTICIGFIISLFKRRKSSIDGEIEKDELIESDEDLIVT